MFSFWLWFLLIIFTFFIITRLLWIYNSSAGTLFWMRSRHRVIIVSGAVFFGLMALVVIYLHSIYFLWLVAVGTYLFFAVPAVRIHDRGILANGYLTAWSDIIQVTIDPISHACKIKSRRFWQLVSFRVPEKQFRIFLKWLEAKHIPIDLHLSAESKASA